MFRSPEMPDFNLTASLHTHNAARGLGAVKRSAEWIRNAPAEKKAEAMALHRELAGRTMASFRASKETADG